MTVSLPSSATGHRERKKQRVREQLTEAALQLFRDRGFEKTTIEDIAAAADVVPRTFFRYFRSKDEVLFAWYERVRDAAVAAVRARPSGEGAVHAFLAAHLQVLENYVEPERIVPILNEVAESCGVLQERRAAWKTELQHALSGELARRLDPSAGDVAAMVTGASMMACSYAIDKWLDEGTSRPLSAYTHPAADKVLELLAEIDRRYVLR
jgi:AcrR family transcriptional regulator